MYRTNWEIGERQWAPAARHMGSHINQAVALPCKASGVMQGQAYIRGKAGGGVSATLVSLKGPSHDK